MMRNPLLIIAIRSRFDCSVDVLVTLSPTRSLSDSAEYNRSLIADGANAMSSPSTTGTSAAIRNTVRRSRSRNSVPIPAQAPTQALRLSVRTRATSTAGRTSAAQIRSRRRNITRATAMQATSMMTPE
jgi:hypothetical protein